MNSLAYFKKLPVFLSATTLIFTVSGCDNSKVNEEILSSVVVVEYVTKEEFKDFKQSEISSLSGSIDNLNDDLKNLKIIISDNEKKIDLQGDLNSEMKDLLDELSLEIKDNRNNISSLEDEYQEAKKQYKSVSKKASKNVVPFPYVISDVSQWGSHILVSIRNNDDYIFMPIGDVIEGWRLQQANIDTRNVIFHHQKTKKTISRRAP